MPGAPGSRPYFGCPVPTHPLQFVPTHPLQFWAGTGVGKPAVDEQVTLLHEVEFADQGGAEVDVGGKGTPFIGCKEMPIQMFWKGHEFYSCRKSLKCSRA